MPCLLDIIKHFLNVPGGRQRGACEVLESIPLWCSTSKTMPWVGLRSVAAHISWAKAGGSLVAGLSEAGLSLTPTELPTFLKEHARHRA